MAKAVKDRAYQKGVALVLGIMEVTGDLVSAKVTGAGSEEKFVSLCPECVALNDGGYPGTVKQFYRCMESGHSDHTMGDLAKGKENDDGEIIPLTKEQVELAKGSELEANVLELNVHRLSDVRDSTFQSGTSYVFRPANGGKLYPVLVNILKQDPELVFIGMMNLRKNDKLIQVTLGLNDQLVLQELVWPEDLKSFEDQQIEVKNSLLETAKSLLEQSVTEFQPEDYRKGSRKRLSDLVSWVTTGGAPSDQPVAEVSATKSDDDLEAVLLAALAAKKAS